MFISLLHIYLFIYDEPLMFFNGSNINTRANIFLVANLPIQLIEMVHMMNKFYVIQLFKKFCCYLYFTANFQLEESLP